VFLQIGDVKLHALSFGEGARTFLCVGGWTGSWEVWEEPLAQLSASGWRCVAYDHRGAGESPVDPRRISVRHMIDDVAAVMDAVGIEQCVLAGESQGGAIAQYASSGWCSLHQRLLDAGRPRAETHSPTPAAPTIPQPSRASSPRASPSLIAST
jgi:pimeloyl-ACP methyl ester carboxylesterase